MHKKGPQPTPAEEEGDQGGQETDVSRLVADTHSGTAALLEEAKLFVGKMLGVNLFALKFTQLEIKKSTTFNLMIT